MSEYVSNCCSVPMDKDQSRCPDCKEGCEAIEVEEEDYMETWLLDK